ncbi:hypothetical protein [Agaribacterium sp. ZY112]|uniref:hypothetical protein n=1 Tax=Agaribacterium sp. ZY112 TaxID=3233574 RepID=UPI0035257281
MIDDHQTAIYQRPWFVALLFSLVLHLALLSLFLFFNSSLALPHLGSEYSFPLKIKLLKREENKAAYVAEHIDMWGEGNDLVDSDIDALNREAQWQQDGSISASNVVNMQASEGGNKNNKLAPLTNTPKAELDLDLRAKKPVPLSQRQELNSRELLDALSAFDIDESNSWPASLDKDPAFRPFDPRQQERWNKAQKRSKAINVHQDSQFYLDGQGQKVVEHNGRCMTLKEDVSTGQFWWTLPSSCSATEADLLLLDLKRRLSR